MSNPAFSRRDVFFDSDGSACAAWLYTPRAKGPHPAVVMAHGLGGQRRFRLDAYAERFADAGLAAMVFDYRHFAESEGEPRQLVSISRQLADWRSAIDFVRSDPSLDSARLALWGTSLSAGHVQVLAADDDRLAAAVAQVPFADGRSASTGLARRQLLRLVLAAWRDRAGAALGRKPHRIPIWGPPGTLAAMTTENAAEAIATNLLPPGEWDDTMPARILASLPNYRPGREAERISCPILYQVAERDRLTPPEPALQAAARAPKAEVRRYAIGHFDIYAGAPFDRAVGDQIAFLTRHLAGD
jgi:uncharacterized protein